MKLLIFLLLTTTVAAECLEVFDGLEINKSTVLCSDTYDLPNGLLIRTSNIVLDCNTAIVKGFDSKGLGIKIEHADNVTIRNCNILTFDQGIFLKNVTNSLIEDNGLLKNRIGIRMIDSYENIIRNNNDKSHQLAVSAVSSKYNIVMHGNKNIERAFCEVNACNSLKEMNLCEPGDFYCSKKCSVETDSDCGTPEIIAPKKEAPVEIVVATPKIVEKLQVVEKQNKILIWIKIIIYLLTYSIGLYYLKR